MEKITKDMIVADILDMDESAASIFLDMGMHCLGCSVAKGETVEEACCAHGVSLDDFLEEINRHIVDN